MLSNISYKNNDIRLPEIIDVIWINDGTIKDFNLSLVPGQKISCGMECESKMQSNWMYLQSRANSCGKHLFNGKSLQIEHIDINKKTISVSKNIDYKTVVSIRSNNQLFLEHNCRPIPNAFVTVNIFISRDNKLVLGKRTFFGDWPNNTYELPGGFSDYDDLKRISLIKIAQKNITQDYDINNCYFETIPFGMYHFPRILETIFLFITRINKDSYELRSKKYSDILFVDNDEEGIKKLITRPISEFHPPSRAALQFLYENYSQAVNILSNNEHEGK